MAVSAERATSHERADEGTFLLPPQATVASWLRAFDRGRRRRRLLLLLLLLLLLTFSRLSSTRIIMNAAAVVQLVARRQQAAVARSRTSATATTAPRGGRRCCTTTSSNVAVSVVVPRRGSRGCYVATGPSSSSSSLVVLRNHQKQQHRRLLQRRDKTTTTTTATTVRKSAAGTGRPLEGPPGLYERTRDRGPVSWPSLFLVGVAAATAVAYYRVERERRLEEAMGKVVSSESEGWTPRPDYLAKRKFVATKWGYFPVEDAFGARELYIYIYSISLLRSRRACFSGRSPFFAPPVSFAFVVFARCKQTRRDFIIVVGIINRRFLVYPIICFASSHNDILRVFFSF